MEPDKPVHSGYLSVAPVGKILIKKFLQKRFCLLFKATKLGVARLELYESREASTQSQTTPKIISLRDCLKIVPKDDTHFAITTTSALYEFRTPSVTALEEWIEKLQSVVFPDEDSKLSFLEEDNDLYCSSGEKIFNVKVAPSPASLRCGLENKVYLLVLTGRDAQLKNLIDNELLFSWPYCFIRRYGFKGGKFTFEAGRKCESGEGIFYLESSKYQEIFKCFALKTKSMKKFLFGEPTPLNSNNSLNLSDSSSLEARCSNTMSTESVLTNRSPLVSKNTKSSRFHTTFPPVPASRESSKNGNEYDKINYETFNRYASVEYRYEAWKTFGVDDVKHLEQNTKVTVEKSKSMDNLVPKNLKYLKEAPKVIMDHTQTEEGYDKLIFFGHANRNTPSLYKEINVSNSTELLFDYNYFKDYDDVDSKSYKTESDHSSKELLIDKQSKTNNDGAINHKLYNNEPYAVITKAKVV